MYKNKSSYCHQLKIWYAHVCRVTLASESGFIYPTWLCLYLGGASFISLNPKYIYLTMRIWFIPKVWIYSTPICLSLPYTCVAITINKPFKGYWIRSQLEYSSKTTVIKKPIDRNNIFIIAINRALRMCQHIDWFLIIMDDRKEHHYEIQYHLLQIYVQVSFWNIPVVREF